HSSQRPVPAGVNRRHPPDRQAVPGLGGGSVQDIRQPAIRRSLRRFRRRDPSYP
ncbi:hypothetical protein BN1723_020795, partial [Verticillium longisporum]